MNNAQAVSSQRTDDFGRAAAETFGISCSCGTYYVGSLTSVGDFESTRCPSCLQPKDSGAYEIPARRTGPAAIDSRNHNLLVATCDLLNKLHGWPMPGLRDEYQKALLAAFKAGAIPEGGKLVVPPESHGN